MSNTKNEEYPDRYHKRWWDDRICSITRESIPDRNRILIYKKKGTESRSEEP